MRPNPVGQTVYIHLSARNLKNLNALQISDTKCRVYQKDQFIGETEISKHNLNPDWRTPIPIVYHFNRIQKIHFEVIDANSDIVGKLTQLAITGEDKKSFIGKSKKKLGKLMGAPKSLTKLSLVNNDQVTGELIVYISRRPPPQYQQQQPQIQQQQQLAQQLIQPQQHIDTIIRWRWGGIKLLDMDFFSKSDPFAKFYRITEAGKMILHETEVIKNNLNPNWKEWQTTLEHLCEHSTQIYIEVWDYDKMGGHDFIGDVTIDYNTIVQQNVRDFQLLTKKNKKAGTLRLQEFILIQPPPPPQPIPQPIPEPIPVPEPIKEISFLDYLMAQWQLSMVIGIDFTFSNQPIYKQDSLHKVSENELNYYQKAIKYIGGSVIAFDYDKKVPVYGFGGKPKFPNYTKNTMDDCFPLNGNKENPFCEDISGILKAYHDSLSQIEFSGPTFVTKIIESAYEFACKNLQENIYTVSMLMTDGQIEDLEDAVKMIAKCSELPMSIIIIGVGDENFKYMKQLDDIEFIKKMSKTDKNLRDIVQFVSYQDYKNDIELMSAQVLDNLPKQFMSYMNLHNILPAQMDSVHLSKAYHNS